MSNKINPINQTQGLIKDVLEFIEQSPWKDAYSSRLQVLHEKADFPCELAIAGRVKAGKSSFLNALLGADLAMVGTTETTATINFFKYGKPLDSYHPVKVVWDDGTEEWQTKQFLDSLQGNTKEILKRAQKIDHLEYYVDNPMLHNITLVDTPGTGALVDEHEIRVNDYLSSEKELLRKKHNDQSVALKEKADAVVVITEHVPTASTNELISRFNDNTSSFNSLGVMTKIDTENETKEGWERRCADYSKMLKQQLNTIIPVSSGIYRYTTKLQEENKLEKMQKALRQIPDEDNMFEELVGQSTIFLSNDDDTNELFDSFGLSYNDRKALVADLPWRVFYCIAKELYVNDIEKAVSNLIEYSGMEKVRTTLEQQFFNRSRVIRCTKIVTQIQTILNELANRYLYDIRFDVNNRNSYLKLVKESFGENDIKVSLIRLIEKNICTKERYNYYETQVKDLIRKTENLLNSFSGTDNSNEGLILLERKQSSFRQNELTELEWLFGKYADQTCPIENLSFAKRQVFWRSRYNMVVDPEVKKIIELAIHSYGIKK